MLVKIALRYVFYLHIAVVGSNLSLKVVHRFVHVRDHALLEVLAKAIERHAALLHHDRVLVRAAQHLE